METTLPAMTLDLFALLGVMLTTASAMEGKRDRGQVVGGGWRTDAPLAHVEPQIRFDCSASLVVASLLVHVRGYCVWCQCGFRGWFFINDTRSWFSAAAVLFQILIIP